MTEELAKQGWNLLATWTPTETSPKKILEEALDSDLRKIGDIVYAKLMPPGCKNVKVPSSGLVLQITKIKDVCQQNPAEKQKVVKSGKRMLKFTLTDGHTSVHGIEVKMIPSIALDTKPGTKVRLKPNVVIPHWNGMFEILPEMIEVLGGHVKHLVERWETDRKMAMFTRAVKPRKDLNPPVWVPFGNPIQWYTPRNPNEDLKTSDDEPSEFDEQRAQAISDATKDVPARDFPMINSKNIEVVQVPKKTFSKPTENKGPVKRGKKGKKGKRGKRRGRNDDSDDDMIDVGYAPAKPTGPVSLFDFLEKDIPEAVAGSGAANSSKPQTNFEYQDNRGGAQFGAIPKDNFRNKPKGDRGVRTPQSKPFNANRAESARNEPRAKEVLSKSKKNDFVSNRPTNDRNTSFQKSKPVQDFNSNKRMNQQKVNNKKFNAQSNTASNDDRKQSDARFSSAKGRSKTFTPSRPSTGPPVNDRREQYHDIVSALQKVQMDGGKKSNIDAQAPKQSGRPASSQMRGVNWTMGKKCLAKYWEDGNLYPAVITALTEKTAVVLFVDYGNHEEVLLADLRPLK